MADFTPGPWETQERDDRERGIAVIAVRPDLPEGSTPTRGMVAWVGQGGANFGKPPTQEANARLIAAAPELLDALKAILAHFDEGYFVRNIAGDNDPAWAVKAARSVATLGAGMAAIEKAEGR